VGFPWPAQATHSSSSKASRRRFTLTKSRHTPSRRALHRRRSEYVAISGRRAAQTTLPFDPRPPRYADDGTYTLAGEAVAGLSAADRARVRNRQIGFIFQAFNLIGDLTVYENVELPLTIVA